MTALLTAVYLALASYYALFIGAFGLGWQRARRASARRQAAARAEPSGDGAPALVPFVSVIVPARNEAANIEACLEALLACDYPPERYEILVVDDCSEDDTAARVRRVMARAHAPALALAGGGDGTDERPAPRIRLLSIAENERRERAHKKYAIERAAAHARGTLLFTTDADCTVRPRWLRDMAAAFPDAHRPLGTPGGVTGFVSGPVLFHADAPVLLRMQALEFLGLAACGAGAIGIGRPTLANGANVGYRADLFRALGGFSGLRHLSSGDDELLMQRIHDATPHHVHFCASPEAAVETEPVRSLRAFYEQRRRWASKGAHYPNRLLVAMLVPVFLFYLALVLAPLAWWAAPGLGPVLALVLGLKMLPELALLAPFAHHFGRGWLMRYFAPAQVLQIPYIVVAAIGGALGGFEWKGRRMVR
ncbi:MAG: glycosyltransferase [Rubricoccaceae bacterium]